MFCTISQPPATIIPPSPFLVIAPFLCPSSICVRSRARAPRRGQEGYFPLPLFLSLSSIFPTHRSLSTVQSEGREESTNIAEPRSRELSPSPSSTTYPQSPSLPHYKSNTLPKYAWLSAVRSSVRPAPPKERERPPSASATWDALLFVWAGGRHRGRAERGAARRRRLRCWRRRCLTTNNSGAMDNAARA